MSAAASTRPAVTLIASAGGFSGWRIEDLIRQASTWRQGVARVLLASDRDQLERVQGALAASGCTSIEPVALDEGNAIGALLALVDTEFWAPIAPELGEEALASRLAALRGSPSSVIACATPLFRVNGPTAADGREVAKVVLQNGLNVLGPPGSMLVRSAALGSGPSSRALAGGSSPTSYLLLWLRLLTRGDILLIPAPADERREDQRARVESEWEHWPLVLREAERLGLFGAPEEAARAESAWRAVGERRGYLGPGSPESPGDEPREPEQESRDPAVLPLRVVVVAPDPTSRPEGRLRTLTTARRALAHVEAVEVVEASDAPLPVHPSDLTWRSGNWPERGMADLVPPSSRATLVLRAGEQVGVRDEGQLRAVLDRLPAGGRVEVITPRGPETRIFGPDAHQAPAPEPLVPLGRMSTPPVDPVRPLSCVRVSELGGDGDWVTTRPWPGVSPDLLRFALYAPDYDPRSGGILALHRLCDLLNGLGHEASIVPMQTGTTNPDWRTPVARPCPVDEDVIAVYPEIVPGNPLGARRVVRWLLNRPGRLNGGYGMQEGPDDLLVAFSAQIGGGLPRLSVPLIDPAVFFPKDVPGRGRLLWVGKGNVPADLDRSEMTAITRTWPATKGELAVLLRSADVLVSADWLTSIISESLMCATPVVLVGEQEWTKDQVRGSDLAFSGLTFADEGADGLDQARREVLAYFPAYVERYRQVEHEVGRFVETVRRHFS